MKVPREMHDILTQNYFGYLCTTDIKNQPHVTPVFFVYDPAEVKIYFITSSRSKKFKNLRSNSKTSLTVDIRDPKNPFRNEGVMVQGVAELKESEPLESQSNLSIRRITEMFIKKYSRLIKPGKDEEDVLVKVHIKKIVHWKGPNFLSIRVE